MGGAAAAGRAGMGKGRARDRWSRVSVGQRWRTDKRATSRGKDTVIPRRWDRYSPAAIARTGCWTWPATCGSGVRIGMIANTNAEYRVLRGGLVGSLIRGTLRAPSESGTILPMRFDFVGFPVASPGSSLELWILKRREAKGVLCPPLAARSSAVRSSVLTSGGQPTAETALR